TIRNIVVLAADTQSSGQTEVFSPDEIKRLAEKNPRRKEWDDLGSQLARVSADPFKADTYVKLEIDPAAAKGDAKDPFVRLFAQRKQTELDTKLVEDAEDALLKTVDLATTPDDLKSELEKLAALHKKLQTIKPKDGFVGDLKALEDRVRRQWEEVDD